MMFSGKKNSSKLKETLAKITLVGAGLSPNGCGLGEVMLSIENMRSFELFSEKGTWFCKAGAGMCKIQSTNCS